MAYTASQRQEIADKPDEADNADYGSDDIAPRSRNWEQADDVEHD